jgi:hypothetical protein
MRDFNLASAIEFYWPSINVSFAYKKRWYVAHAELLSATEPDWQCVCITPTEPATGEAAAQIRQGDGPLWTAAQEAVNRFGLEIYQNPDRWLGDEDLAALHGEPAVKISMRKEEG